MERHESKLIQHLGIIAGVCKEIRLAELIDRQVDNGDRKVTIGEAVVAMVLNAMGFTGRPLYLNHDFMKAARKTGLSVMGSAARNSMITAWELPWTVSMKLESPSCFSLWPGRY